MSADAAIAEPSAQSEDVNSRYRPVWGKKPLSLRIRGDVRASLDVMVEIWRRRQIAAGLSADSVDLTHIIEEVMGDEAKAELARYGITDEDLPRSEDEKVRKLEAKAIVERIGHLIDDEAKK